MNWNLGLSVGRAGLEGPDAWLVPASVSGFEQKPVAVFPLTDSDTCDAGV